MNDKINLTKPDGTQVNGDVICFLENKDTKKRYVYYTLNEIVGADTSSTVKIYVSKIKQDDPNLDAQITDEDWNILKGYMGDALKDSINPNVTYLPLSELGTPVSVSERAIAMPTSYDYINKQRGIYAQSVATQGSQENVATSPVAESTVAAVEPTPTTPEPIVASIEPTIPDNTAIPAEQPPVVEPTPAPSIAEPNPAPIEPVPVAVEPAIPPIESVSIEQPPVVESPAAVEPPIVEPPKVEPVPTVVEPPKVEPTPAPIDPFKSNIESTAQVNVKQEPIDIAMIEKKYADMIDSINKLKEQELEAVKRYNATIELSSMHNEQHANYIQNEQIKENNGAPAPVVNPGPVPAPMEPTPVVDNPPTLVAPPVGVEPVPVSPVVPEPQAQPQTNIETNWFDMPENN